MAGKTLAEMSPAERDAAIKRAASKLQTELEANADTIGAILEMEPAKMMTFDEIDANRAFDELLAEHENCGPGTNLDECPACREDAERDDDAPEEKR